MAVERAERPQLPYIRQRLWQPEIVRPQPRLWVPSDKPLLEQFELGIGEARLMRMDSRELDETLLAYTNKFLFLTGDYVGALTIQSGNSALRSISVRTREDNKTPDGDHPIRGTIKLLANELPAWEQLAQKLATREQRLRRKLPVELELRARQLAQRAVTMECHDLPEDYGLTRGKLGILLFQDDPSLPGPDREFVDEVYIGIDALNINRILSPGAKATELDYERYEARIAATHERFPRLGLPRLKVIYDRGDSMKGDLSRYLRENTPEARAEARARLAKSVRKTDDVMHLLDTYEPEYAFQIKADIKEIREIIE